MNCGGFRSQVCTAGGEPAQISYGGFWSQVCTAGGEPAQLNCGGFGSHYNHTGFIDAVMVQATVRQNRVIKNTCQLQRSVVADTLVGLLGGLMVPVLVLVLVLLCFDVHLGLARCVFQLCTRRWLSVRW